MGRDEYGFDDDPFADFSQRCVVQDSRTSRGANKSRRGGVGPRTKSSESISAASHMSGESMMSASRTSRRRPTHDYNDDGFGDNAEAGGAVPTAAGGGELVLPGNNEHRRRRRGDGRSRCGESVDGGRSIESSSSGSASRPRRGRRASLVSSMSQDQIYSQSAHAGEQDYGYSDTRSINVQRTQSNDLDYGYGAPGGAAPPGGGPARRRGRRMSVGAPMAPSVAAPEADYSHGETKPSYDEKFGKTSSHGEDEEKAPTERKQRSNRDRAVNISDIKNTDLTAREARQGSSSRDLGGNPRPNNTSVVPFALTDGQKPQRTRRRASMLGAVGAAVEGTVGVVGDLAGSVGNAAAGAVRIKGGKDEETTGTRRPKGRRMSMVQVIADEENNVATAAGGDDRRRQGTMLERLG